MAAYWFARGIDTVIVTANHWRGGACNEDGVPVIAAESGLTAQTRSMLDLLLPVMGDLERELHHATPERIRTAMKSWAEEAQAPSLLPPLVDGVLIAEAVRSLNPVGVLGQEAFAYGMATALCTGYRRTMLIWGGDVMQFCNTSDTTERLMRSVLHQMTYLLLGSTAVQDRVISQFGIDPSKAPIVRLGVDTAKFERPSEERRKSILARYGIPNDADVVLNARRLRDHWGSSAAVDAMLATLTSRPGVHAVCIGGEGTEATSAAARGRAVGAGVASRFLAIDGDIAEQDFADLVGVAGVFLSLTRDDEPLSLSVLQGAAAGGVPVIGNQQTYRHACESGLNAVLVPHNDPPAITSAVCALLDAPVRRQSMADANRQHILADHDLDRHMERLLRIIVGAEAANQLMRDTRLEPVA